MVWSELSTTRPIAGESPGEHAPRILCRNDHSAIDLSCAHVFARLLLVVVWHRGEGTDVYRDRVKRLVNLQRLGLAVVVDHPHARPANLAAKGVAEDEELH